MTSEAVADEHLDVGTIAQYVFDTLPADEQARVDEHAAECECCSEALADGFEELAPVVRAWRSSSPMRLPTLQAQGSRTAAVGAAVAGARYPKATQAGLRVRTFRNGALAGASAVAFAALVALILRPEGGQLAPHGVTRPERNPEANVSSSPPSEMTPKSAMEEHHEVDRWAGIQVYRVVGSITSAVEKSISRRDDLVFSYTNIGGEPFEYLLIFGVDAQNEVRWFYPRYERLHANPTSIRIQRGEHDVSLGESIHAELPTGTMVIYAVFTRAPIGVVAVETVVGGPHGTPARLPIPDSAQHRLVIQVDP